MGREIRKVKPDWHHPKNELGHDQPMYDHSFTQAATDWTNGIIEWVKKYPTGFDDKGNAYWEWNDDPPSDREYYRPEWTEGSAIAYQIYETVTEGTPVSPVFQTVDDMRAWLLSEWKLSEHAADHFIKTEYSFSMIMTSRGITKPGADTIEAMARLDDSN